MAEVIENLELSLHHIDDDIARVETSFHGTVAYVRERYIESERDGGWRQFLQEDGSPTVAGTACLVASLLRMGVSRRDPQIVAAVGFLIGAARDDGGWSKPEFDEHLSLTLLTCLAMQALGDAGLVSGTPVVEAGLKWLENARNPDGGWGNTAGDGHSDVTSTAYAMRTIAEFDPSSSLLDPAQGWLLAAQNADGGWGIRCGEVSTVAHTAHAAEGLLAAAGPGPVTVPIVAWISQRIASDPIMPWVEHYSIPPVVAKNLPPNLRSARLRWTHLPTERSLIALMKLGADPTEKTIRTLVAELSARRQGLDYWTVPSLPGVAASWAILEGVNALSLYTDSLRREGRLAAFRIAAKDLDRRLQDVEQVAAEMVIRVARLEGAKRERTRRLLRLIGHAVTAPSAQAGAVVAVTSGALLAYVGMWSHSIDAGSRLLGAATILVPAFALLEMIRRRRNP